MLIGAAGNTLSTLAVGSPNQLLTVSSITDLPEWVTSSAFNFFQLANGAIAPLDTGDDFLLGGAATASAKFGFINNATGVPTATISANLGDNATYLTGDGTLATTNKQSLTIGSASTGNIDLFGFGTGIIHSNVNGVLSSSAVNLAGGPNGR